MNFAHSLVKISMLETLEVFIYLAYVCSDGTLIQLSNIYVTCIAVKSIFKNIYLLMDVFIAGLCYFFREKNKAKIRS